MSTLTWGVAFASIVNSLTTLARGTITQTQLSLILPDPGDDGIHPFGKIYSRFPTEDAFHLPVVRNIDHGVRLAGTLFVTDRHRTAQSFLEEPRGFEKRK